MSIGKSITDILGVPLSAAILVVLLSLLFFLIKGKDENKDK